MTEGNEHLLHHMEVFHCVPQQGENADFPIWSGPCGSDEAPQKLIQCKKVLAAWAIGAGPFTYPPEAGLQIGGNEFASLYVMLEVHFNNENKESGKEKSIMRMFFVLVQNFSTLKMHFFMHSVMHVEIEIHTRYDTNQRYSYFVWNCLPL